MKNGVRPEEGWESAGGQAGKHLSPQDMDSYLSGALDAERESEVQEHLVACPDCVDRLLLDPAAWDANGDAQVRSFETAVAWRALQDRLALERLRRWQRPGLAAAAALVLALGLSLGQNAVDGERLAELERPQLNVPISDLDPNARQRGEVAEIVVEVPDEAAFTTLILPLEPQDEPLGEVTVQIADAGGRVLWSGSGLEVEYDTATLGLPRGFLDPGSYRIRLYSAAADAPPRQIGDYPVRILYD